LDMVSSTDQLGTRSRTTRTGRSQAGTRAFHVIRPRQGCGCFTRKERRGW
jgi:hypothetical protein